ncbi:hypothetical protein E3U47_07020 [Pseudomonas sp. RIT623]|nr:hypothetical protein E3U47_07020 [Pseudomonas sp. RIT623]
MVLLEYFFWLALQLLSPLLRARAVPLDLSSGKTHCEGRGDATDGLFFIERATVCHEASATDTPRQGATVECHHCNPGKC